jgi:hypothetical protein
MNIYLAATAILQSAEHAPVSGTQYGLFWWPLVDLVLLLLAALFAPAGQHHH